MAVMWPITTAAAAAATAENYRDHRRDSQLTTDTSHYHQRVALATRASRAASFSRCRMHSILDMDMGIKSHVKSSRCQVMSQVAKSSSCSPGSHLNKNKNIAGNSPPLVPCAGQFAPQAKYCALHWLPIAIGGDAQTLGARRAHGTRFLRVVVVTSVRAHARLLGLQPAKHRLGEDFLALGRRAELRTYGALNHYRKSEDI